MRRKTVPLRIRLTQHQMLQVSELAELMNSNVTAVVRASVIKFVEELQNEEGDWKISNKSEQANNADTDG